MLRRLRLLRDRLAFASAREIPSLLLSALRLLIWQRRELCVYAVPAHEALMLGSPAGPCRRDCYDDLLSYNRGGFYELPRDKYLAEAAKRRDSANHVYTLVDGGVLVHVGWLCERQEVCTQRIVGCVLRLPPNSAVLWDFITHPSARGRGLYRRTLQQLLHDAVKTYGAAWVYIFVEAYNHASRHVIEKVGFEYQGSMVQTTLLFWTRRRIISAAPAFDAAPLEPGLGAPQPDGTQVSVRSAGQEH